MVQVLNRRSNRASAERLRKRSEARRVDILRAAARVFRRRGTGATGMREIAEEAELSPGNLYYYFESKDELLHFCQERTLKQLLAAVDAAKTAATCAERLRAVLRTHVYALLDEMEGATAHLEIESLPDTVRIPLIKKRDSYERAVRALVMEGVARGEFASCDAALVTRAMLGAVNWTARWYRPNGPKSADEIAGAMADYLVKGLA